MTWRGRLLAGLAALGVLLAAVAGIAWVFLSNTGYWPGSSMTTAWETRGDGGAPEHGSHHAWLVGDTVVRARYDAVTGFDAASGRMRWEYLPPRRADICATSASADGSLVLIAYGERGEDAYGSAVEAGKGCATVAALDLADGRELWRTARRPATGGLDDGDGVLAAGGGLGVVLDDGEDARAVRAVELRTGTPRWTAAVPTGCVPGQVAIAPKDVLAVLTCGDELKLSAFDPADGTERWTVPLDARRGVAADATAAFTSVEPIVLRVDEGGRGVDAFLAFGPDGRPGARIESTGDRYGSIRSVSVADGRLFARTSGGRWGLLAAFDLATGEELWQTGLGGARYTVSGLHAEGGRVMAVMSSAKYGDALHVFDAATGDEEEDRAFRDGIGPVQDLLPYKDLVIAVRSGGNVKPFSAYERW
ncbi:PQQ-binding-like beta-propeller repeat protein [Kitasatospora phosalacinea]|uniref:PQQ-binding-like beta-propeller repeat protein n=1 Tax=Kitasatospora phosalacinea TaxID=2065 RepID=A0ABW6GVC1_9ACTN